MKYIKALGLALIVSAATMAIFGASSAFAVQICAVGVVGDGKCATASTEAESDAPFSATSSNPVFQTNVATITCEHSETTIDPSTATGFSVITGSVTAFSLSGNCKTNGNIPCTVTVVNLPYEAHILANDLLMTDATGVGATVKCGFLMNCTLSIKEMELQVTHSGNNTILHANAVALQRSGGFCPETASWHADYTAQNRTID